MVWTRRVKSRSQGCNADSCRNWGRDAGRGESMLRETTDRKDGIFPSVSSSLREKEIHLAALRLRTELQDLKLSTVQALA